MRLIIAVKLSVLTLAVVLLILPARAFDPPTLGKAEAKRILEFMDWQEVTIVAIRQGVDAKGVAAPIYATVLGIGKCQGRHQTICQTLYFDSELDWHVLELNEKSARVWTKCGLREIRPWASW